jgi:hypothetical protein
LLFIHVRWCRCAVLYLHHSEYFLFSSFNVYNDYWCFVYHIYQCINGTQFTEKFTKLMLQFNIKVLVLTIIFNLLPEDSVCKKEITIYILRIFKIRCNMVHTTLIQTYLVRLKNCILTCFYCIIHHTIFLQNCQDDITWILSWLYS